MDATQREMLINVYIEAYNNLDVDAMMAGLHPDVEFKNISNGDVNMVLNGSRQFKEQAKQTTSYFESRRQTVTSFKHTDGQTEAEVSYQAILAFDLPNGPHKGDKISLHGRSIFKFSDGKIISVTDIS